MCQNKDENIHGLYFGLHDMLLVFCFGLFLMQYQDILHDLIEYLDLCPKIL